MARIGFAQHDFYLPRKWLRDGRYIYKPNKITSHHDIVKFEFVMVTIPGGNVEARGLSFLIVAGDGRIQSDLQFDPTVDEARKFTERYLTVFNAEDAETQRDSLIKVWAPDAIYVRETSVKYGYADLLSSAEESHQRSAQAESVWAAGKGSQAHHDMVTFQWQIEHRRTGALAGIGSELVILDAFPSQGRTNSRRSVSREVRSSPRL